MVSLWKWQTIRNGLPKVYFDDRSKIKDKVPENISRIQDVVFTLITLIFTLILP